MTDSFLGDWLSNSIVAKNKVVPVKACFHVSLEKNMFWPNREKITCLKANYIFVYVRLQPLFFELLSNNTQFYFNGHQLTGKYKVTLRDQSGFKLEQVVDPSRRTFTNEPEDIVFNASTLNPKKVAVQKLKAEELSIKFKRMKLAMARDCEYINFRVGIYAETTAGEYLLIDEWQSKEVHVRFGNCAQYADIKNISTKEREREYNNELYSEIMNFQKSPSIALLDIKNNTSTDQPVQLNNYTYSIDPNMYLNSLNFFDTSSATNFMGYFDMNSPETCKPKYLSYILDVKNKL
ncbi:hypothetical protein HDV06_001673 [Boothiomyces sp. JEL0866]|nr:hypothetical protein HDV06_001673 [Boothiomyces sp. JEL0866]